MFRASGRLCATSSGKTAPMPTITENEIEPRETYLPALADAISNVVAIVEGA